MPLVQRQCYLTVLVANTDYDEPDEFILHTMANGEKVHGRCSPVATIYSPAAVVSDVNGASFFECAKMVALPLSPDSTYTFVTTASPAVDENAYEGSFVHVEYMVDCEGTCKPPSAPPAPPPMPPTCAYSSTPVGGGDGSNVTSTFTDPHAPMPLPPPPVSYTHLTLPTNLRG